MAQAVPNLCISRKVFLKHQQFMVRYRICPRFIHFLSVDNPVEFLNEHLSLLVGHYVPSKVSCVLDRNKPWFDDQFRRDFDLQQEAHLWCTSDRSRVDREEFIRCQGGAN